MFEIQGKYSVAKIFAETIDNAAISQLVQLCSQKFTEGAKIRIMPDVHAGKGCTIGFTADLGDMVIPSLVGADIGCGMLCVKLGKTDIDFNRFDEIVRQYVPAGNSFHEEAIAAFPAMNKMHCFGSLEKTIGIERYLGTLGGGNHFIELDKDENGDVYLVIHTGSRSLGKQVAEYYQERAFAIQRGKEPGHKTAEIPRELCYLIGESRQCYLDDMAICQNFATLNRETIANQILFRYGGKKLKGFEHFETVHNYIDLKYDIVRKGAISAQESEMILIPINMRDGSLICVGKGNEEWNCSAPHGAGRLLARNVAKSSLSLEEYQEQMQGIYTSCVSYSTIDESPMAYKNMEEIVEQIGPTAEIVKVIKPIYNFKA